MQGRMRRGRERSSSGLPHPVPSGRERSACGRGAAAQRPLVHLHRRVMLLRPTLGCHCPGIQASGSGSPGRAGTRGAMLPLEAEIPGDRWANPPLIPLGFLPPPGPWCGRWLPEPLGGQDRSQSWAPATAGRRAAGKSLAAPSSGKSLRTGPGHVGGSALWDTCWPWPLTWC